MKYYSTVTFSFKCGLGYRCFSHDRKFETKSDYDQLVDVIREDNELPNPDTVIIVNILTFKNQ